MTKTQLEEIREACIGANPEMVFCSLFEGRKGWQYNYNVGRGASYSSNPFPTKDEARLHAHKEGRASYRPIRLADVLLALNKIWSADYVVNTAGVFLKESDEGNQSLRPEIIWNLREDNLNSQSEETIAFIHSLLK